MRISFPRRNKPAPEPVPVPEETPVDDGHAIRMGLFEHLNELRQRLTRAFLALIVATLLGIFLAGNFFEFLLDPYCRVSQSTDCRLQTLGPTESVVSYFRVALMFGGVVAVPAITYQILMFILPGLTTRERRFIIFSIPAIALLFVVGALFAWYLLMPPALGFLESFQPTIFKPDWTADLYLSFVTALVFWMGVAFETPLVFFVLSLLGFVRARVLARNWRLAVVGASIAAAFITPTIDPVNMFLVMAPLLGLYTLSIILVAIGTRIGGHHLVDAS